MSFSLSAEDVVKMGEEISVRMALSFAADGKWDMVKDLLNAGVSVSKKIDKMSLGKMVMLSGNEDAIECLRKNNNVLDSKAFGTGAAPLIVAASTGNLALAKEVLSANPKEKPTVGLYNGSKLYPSEIAAERDDLDMLVFLHERKLTKSTYPLVMRGIAGGASLETIDVLSDWAVEYGNYDMEIGGRWDFSSLSKYVSPEAFDFLSVEGDRIGICNMLSYALVRDRRDVFDLLCSKMSSLEHLTYLGGFPEEIHGTAFYVAILQDDAELFEYLVEKCGGSEKVGDFFVDAENDYWDSFISSPKKDWGSAMQVGEEQERNIRKLSSLRRTNPFEYFLNHALQNAVSRESWKVTGYLLRHGADLNLAKGRHGVLSEADRSNIEHQVLTVGSNSNLVDMNKRKASGL